MNYVNQSRIKAWRKCARSYHYKYEMNLTTKKPRIQLIRGSILHEMIDAYAKHGKKSSKPQEILEGYSKKYRALFLEEREAYGDLIGDCSKLYDRYIDFHEGQDLRFIESEYDVSVELYSGMRYVGRIDKIVEDSNGQRWLMDHKSHKKIPDEKARFHDMQTLMYIWAYNQMKPKERVIGVVWDYIRTKLPTVPDLLKSGRMSERDYDTDYTTYHQALIDNNLDPADYSEYLKKLKGKQLNFFKRVQLPSPKPEMTAQIVEELTQTARVIQTLRTVYKARTLTKDCSWCDFQPLCQAELRNHDVNFVLKSEYTERDPETYDAEEGDEEE